MRRWTAIDTHALNGDTDIRAEMLVDGADGSSIRPRYRGRAFLRPDLDEYQHNVRSFTFRVWPAPGAGMDSDEFGELAWGIFDPERGERTLKMRRDPEDADTEYQATVLVTEFVRTEAFVWEGEVEFRDPYWLKVTSTTETSSPITVGGNAVTRPTITLANGEPCTHYRVTLLDTTGHGFAGWPVAITVGAGDASECRAFFDGHEVPFSKDGTTLWVFGAGKAGQTSYVDVYQGSGISNTLYADMLDTGGLDLSTWSSNTVTSDPSGARVQPQNVALAWRPGITFKPAESRNYTFGLDGDVLTLVDREATGTRYSLNDDADALVTSSPVPITKLSGLGLSVHAGYRPGIRDSQSEDGERVLRVTISDYNGGFETGPTNPEYYQHPDSRHPDRPYYATWTFGGITFPNTRSVTMPIAASGTGTFTTREKWFDDYLPSEFKTVIEKYLGVEVTTGEVGEYFLHFPAGAYLGAELPDLTMSVQPKSGEWVDQTLIDDPSTIYARIAVGNAALEYVTVYHTEWVDPDTLEPLDDTSEQALAGQIKAVVKYMLRDAEGDWITKWSQVVSGAAPGGTTQAISVPEQTFPAGTVAVAIGLEPVNTNPSRVDWGTLEVTSAPTITLDSDQMPTVTVNSEDGQHLNGFIRNDTSGAAIELRGVLSPATGVEIDTANLTIEPVAGGMVYGQPLPSGGVRMWELSPGSVTWSTTGNLDQAEIEIEYQERLAV